LDAGASSLCARIHDANGHLNTRGIITTAPQVALETRQVTTKTEWQDEQRERQ
jgi:hypothetical protein